MPAKPRFFRTPEAFGAWLEANHAKAPELVVGYWKVSTGKPSMTWAQSVEQALRFGWIDGIRRSLGEHSYTIRFTPRKAGSHWSKVNIATAKRLIADGGMAPAGAAAFKALDPKRTGQGAYAQERPVPMPAPLLRRLKADPVAWRSHAARPPWYQRTVSWWLASAKRDETRERRFAHLLETARAGRPVRGLDREAGGWGAPKSKATPKRSPRKGPPSKSAAKRAKGVGKRL